MPNDKAPLPRRFWMQFSASAVSNLGDGMNAAALPLLAIMLTNDARLISAVTFSAMVPWLVLSLPAGVYIDRWNRSRVMVVANFTRAVVYAGIAFGIATNTLSIWGLFPLLIVIGACEVFFDMSSQAFLPSLVNADQLQRANGLLYAIEVVLNSFVGLPIGAWLFVIASGVPFGVNGASFALAALIVARLSRNLPITTSAANATPTRFKDDFAQGITWLWRHRQLRTLALLLGVTNGALTMSESIFVKFAFEYLGVGPRGYGLLLAFVSAGAMFGGLVGDRIANRLGATGAIIFSYAIFASTDFVRALFPNVAVVVAMSVTMALAGTVWNVVTVSYRQRIIPAHLFGRVNSAYRFIGTGSVALGALIGGQLAHHFGLRAPFFVGASVTAFALVLALPTLLRDDFVLVEAPATT
ncbi:MAG: MFS transporter [Ilumatobacteraceae bacterium]|nr:MFS transporter [Ilumatobacteraceae bacterium]